MYVPLLALPAASYPQAVSSMVPIAISFMVTFIALVYMAAQILKKPEWEQTVGSELYQLFVSLIIFISIFSLYAGVNAAVHELTGGQDGSLFDVAQRYLQTVTYGEGANVPAGQKKYEGLVQYIMKLEVFKLGLQHLAGLYFRLGPTGWGMQWAVFPGVEVVEKSVDFTITIMTPVTASIIAQQIGIQLLAAFCPLLVAVGVLLRIFAPTRDAGSFMIVSGFAFSFVFPFTYYMHEIVADYMWEQEGAGADAQEGFGGLQGEDGIALGVLWNAINPASLFTPLRMLGFSMLQALFLPALSMVVTVSFIKSTLKFVSQKLD